MLFRQGPRLSDHAENVAHALRLSRRPGWFFLRLRHGAELEPKRVEHVLHRGCTWLGPALCFVALDGGADAFNAATGAISYQARELGDAEFGIFSGLDEELAEHEAERNGRRVRGQRAARGLAGRTLTLGLACRSTKNERGWEATDAGLWRFGGRGNKHTGTGPGREHANLLHDGRTATTI